MSGARVIIVGGGVIGLACAWRLAQAGCAVQVLDAAPEAREASWAAAGMLAPHHEADAAGPLWRLGVGSLALWDGFARALTEGDPAALDFRADGGLLPLCGPADVAAAEARAAFLADQGVAVGWLDRAALASCEPALAADAALLLPAAQVNPRLVTAALVRACAAAGVAVRYGCAVAGLEPGRVVIGDGTRLAADELVLASGAWTPELARLTGLDLPGEPVKGQMLRLEAPDDLLRHFVHSHHAYLVPRRGQGVVVGATMVSAGFDRRDDPAAIEALAAGARRLLPALAGAAILERWTGLRPRLASGLPALGRVRPGLVLATGHFRNGVLLTPVTAEIVTGLITGRQSSHGLAPFAPGPSLGG